MTDAAAWLLIAERLDDSTQKLESIALEKPPGAVGYVMKVILSHLSKRVYVKFEFVVLSDKKVICGRSFHLEDPR